MSCPSLTSTRWATRQSFILPASYPFASNHLSRFTQNVDATDSPRGVTQNVDATGLPRGVTQNVDATGLPRGVTQSADATGLPRGVTQNVDATGLPRGVFTFVAKQNQKSNSPDATGLSRGVSRSLLSSWKREPPRPKAVASSLRVNRIDVATSVRDSTGQARGIFDCVQSFRQIVFGGSFYGCLQENVS